MPTCHYPSHNHPPWPKAGPLVICAGERTCGYCSGADARAFYNQALRLRQHVREHHTDGGLMDFGGVEVKMCSPSEPKPVNSRSSLPSGTKKGGNAHSSLLPENTRRISAGHHHSHESTEITRRLCGKGTKKQHEECSVSSAAFQPTTRTKPSMIVKLPISQHSRPQSSNKQAIPQSRPATLKQVDNSKKATSTFKSSNLYLPPHPPALPSSQQTSRFSASGPAPQGTVNALATAVATWLMSLSANAGKVLPVETVRRSLARTSSFLQLCEALEGLGFQCERTELAAIVSGAKYGGTK